jgi:drug/metabolite transporter (DMT)-like permease
MNASPPSRVSGTALPPAGFALLAGLTLFWGLNWPGMKIILSELPVWWFRTSCVLIGGGALLAISAASGNRVLMQAREVPLVAVCAAFNVFAWHLFSAYGVANMPAGRAAIIAFTMPVWAAVFSSLMLGERFDRAKVTGLVLGVAGLGVLIGPDLMALEQAPLGAGFMLAAALSWGFGTVLFKRGGWSLPVASHVGWQLVLSGIPLGLGAALTEPFPDLGSISREAALALAYIYVFPMTFCQWAYFKTVHLFPASIAAIGTLLIPVVGVYSSHFILAEPVGWREVTALALICAALASVLVLPSLGRGRA